MKTKPNTLPSEFAGLDDWFPVFRTGEHTDSKGTTRTFTQADLDSIVANHSGGDDAPFVFGHPKHNDPAYGWTDALKRDGDVLFAKGRDVVAEFGEAVKKKMFPNRSIKIVPQGDGWQLEHIGFLGAKRPAVAGLGNITFSADDNAIEFAMSTEEGYDVAYGFSTVARMLRGFREWIISEKNLEEADRIMPDWKIDSLSRVAADVRPADGNNFNASDEDNNMDPNNPKQFSKAELDAAIESAVNQVRTESSTEVQKLQFAAARREAEATIDALKTEGKLLPAQCDGLAEFMANLPTEDAGAFEFAASDGKTTVKKTPAEFMGEFLKSLGKQIEFGKDTTDAPDEGGSSYSAYAGATVNPERAALDKKAREYMTAHKCDYVTAVTAVEGQ